MPIGEWFKVKIATHLLQPLYNRRSPGRPWHPAGAVSEARLDDTGSLLTARLAGARLDVSVVTPRIMKIIVSFDSVRPTPYYNGEYFSYAVAKGAALPLVLKEDDQRFELKSAGSGNGLSLALAKATGRIEVRDASGAVIAQAGCASAGDWVSLEAQTPRPVRWLGFGQKTGGLFKNGRHYTMWNTDFADMMKDSDPLYQSCPLAIFLTETGAACGLFFDNPHYARFRIPRSGRHAPLHYSAARGPLALYILGGPNLKDVVRQFSELTGHYRLPPLWALGHHHSRWEPDESAGRLTDIARQFRARRIPLDALHIDIGFMRGYRCFTWDPERFPDPASFVRALHDLAIHPVIITDPGLKRDEEWDIYKEGKAEGRFLMRADGAVVHEPVWPGPSAFPDFGSVKTTHWWGSLFAGHVEKKIDGFWVDMNEPAAFTPRRTLADDVLHTVDPAAAGGALDQRDHASLHNYYGFLMAKATAEGLERLRPGERTFLFTRSSYAGIQRYASSWTGDNKSDWDHLRLSLPMVMNLGLSGQIMTGPDIGGFWGAPTPELFVRFLQAATFFPFHRNHTASGTPPQEIWHFGPEIEAVCADLIRLRYEHLLYLYTALRQGTLTGDPVCRPLVYDFPSDIGCLQDSVADTQYLCGQRLLVAPVLMRGKNARAVYFPGTKTDDPLSPPTEWVCYRTNTVYRGGTTGTIDAPLERLPLFVRKGSAVPVVLAGPDGFVSSAGLHAQTLAFDIYPAPSITGELYLDDGSSLDYRQNKFALIGVSGSETEARLVITIEQIEGELPAPLAAFSGLLLRVASCGRPPLAARTAVNGRELSADRSARDGDWLVVSLPRETLPLRIEIDRTL
jgi:alpha-glucosidase